MHSMLYLLVPSLVLVKLTFCRLSTCAHLWLAEHALTVWFVFVSPFARLSDLTPLEDVFTVPSYDTALRFDVESLGAYSIAGISGDRLFLPALAYL